MSWPTTKEPGAPFPISRMHQNSLFLQPNETKTVASAPPESTWMRRMSDYLSVEKESSLFSFSTARNDSSYPPHSINMKTSIVFNQYATQPQVIQSLPNRNIFPVSPSEQFTPIFGSPFEQFLASGSEVVGEEDSDDDDDTGLKFDEHQVLSPLFDNEEPMFEPDLDDFSLRGDPPGLTGHHGGSDRKKDKFASPNKKDAVKLSLRKFHSLPAKDQIDEDFDTQASPVLWVGNIGPLVTEEQLLKEFRVHGNIVHLRILKDRFCAFITFETTKEAVNAKQSLNGEIFGNQYIVINFRKAPNTADISITNPKSNSLWVGNIGDGVTKSELEYEFGQFGEVESVRLLKNCAFINFRSVREATNALEGLQGKKLGSMYLKINYGKPRTSV